MRIEARKLEAEAAGKLEEAWRLEAAAMRMESRRLEPWRLEESGP